MGATVDSQLCEQQSDQIKDVQDDIFVQSHFSSISVGGGTVMTLSPRRGRNINPRNSQGAHALTVF
jgi:hypothetical protein